MAYFNREVSLFDMVRHIYGYTSVLQNSYRPNMFIKELQLYVSYLKEHLLLESETSEKQMKKWMTFKDNLLSGIDYYSKLFTHNDCFDAQKNEMLNSLDLYKTELEDIAI